MRRFRRVRGADGASLPTSGSTSASGSLDRELGVDLRIVVGGILALALMVLIGHLALGGGALTPFRPVSGSTPVGAAAGATASQSWNPTQAPAGGRDATPGPPPPSGSSGGAGLPQVGPGYQLAAADGGVFSFGNARYAGSMGASALAAPVVALADTPDGQGYWEVAADGGVFSFGDAHYYGGMAGKHLAAPVVGIASAPDGQGYWLVSADGGVFTYGDASYLGGMAGRGLRAPIIGIAANPTGSGYWLVSADGGVFTYGQARYFGGMAGYGLAAPVVGIAPTLDGQGYWLVSADGGVFTYGDARYFGGMGGLKLAAPMVGIAASPTGQGYWMASADGGVFTYGDAGFWGAPGGFALNQPVTAVAAGLHPAYYQPEVEVGGRYGYDISWPQCGRAALPPAHAFVVLGVTGGKAFTTNSCLAAEWSWASQAAGATGLYLNLNGADLGDVRESLFGPAGRCRTGDAACKSYNYGANTASSAASYAKSLGVGAPMWWLDVETENAWNDHNDVNALVVQGAIDELHRMHLQAGIYSTPYQWNRIAGSAQFNVPVWAAGSPDLSTSASYCARGFSGGPVWMVQTLLDYDVDYLCRPTAAEGAFGVHPLPAAPTWSAPVTTLPVHPAVHPVESVSAHPVESVSAHSQKR